MKSVVLKQFGAFWEHVFRAERDILDNRRPVTPMNIGDPWEEKDEDFFKTWEGIKTYLSKFRLKRFFYSPVGLMIRSGPYQAETAHEALCFFLLKPHEYETATVLDSKEYLAIKEEALNELKSLQEADEKSFAKKRQSQVKKNAEEQKMGALWRVIYDHMIASQNKVNPLPLSCKEIQTRLLPITLPQPTISRYLAKLFNAPNNQGLSTYKECFKSKDLKTLTGFMNSNQIFDRAVEDPELED